MTSPLLTARAALTRSRAQALRTRLEDVRASLRALAPHERAAGDQGDLAGATVDQWEAATTRDRLLVEERALAAAIDRVNAGTYGVCSDPDCGEEIGEARLVALPGATLCVRCQAAWERAAANDPWGTS